MSNHNDFPTSFPLGRLETSSPKKTDVFEQSGVKSPKLEAFDAAERGMKLRLNPAVRELKALMFEVCTLDVSRLDHVDANAARKKACEGGGFDRIADIILAEPDVGAAMTHLLNQQTTDAFVYFRAFVIGGLVEVLTKKAAERAVAAQAVNAMGAEIGERAAEINRDTEKGPRNREK